MSADTLITAVTPEGVEYTLRPAGLVARGSAYAIDELIQTVLFVFPLTISITVTGRPLSWFFFLAGFAITWFYYTCFEIFWNGRSPGKRIMGLRVIMSNGAPITPSASLLRNIVRFADEFLGLVTIGLVSVVFSPGFRRLGDWAASTLVVYERADANVEDVSGNPRWLDGRKPQQPGRPLSGEEKRQILAFSTRYPKLGEERANEIAALVVSSITDDPIASTYPADYLLSLAAGMIGAQELTTPTEGSRDPG